jgi:hypothetical protein
MKHLKLFEEIYKIGPQIGDYVICDESFLFHNENDYSFKKILDFENSNIGQYIKDIKLDTFPYLIQYENVPNFEYFEHGSTYGYSNCRKMSLDEIRYWSPNKKDLEHYIITNKYNL